MARVSFKNVGQGDSIIISWKDDDVSKLGIIDCHRINGRNPVLDHIAELDEVEEIDFIVISHGHRDHYSGIKELLDYCEKNEIKINYFTTTLQPSTFQILEITQSRQELSAISKLFDHIDKLYGNGLILDLFPTYNKITNWEIGELSLVCLYPRAADYKTLGNSFRKYIKGEIKTKPDLNYISSIFKLIGDQHYSLLTSDCVIESLDYIERKDRDIINSTLLMAQVPHHGSINNHNRLFWSRRKRIGECPSVISSGESRHGLPDEQVVKDFWELDYKIYSTNYVHGIKNYVEGTAGQDDYSYVLDSFSELESESVPSGNDRFCGDKNFDMTKRGVEFISPSSS